MNKRFIQVLGLCLFFTSVSACRFGNYAEQPKANFKEKYKTIDLYFTEALSFATATVFNDNSGHSNLNASLAMVPTSVRNTFSNPLYFVTPIDLTKLPMFIGINQESFVETALDANGKIADSYANEWGPLWENPACETKIQIDQQGEFDLTHPGSVQFSDGSISPVNGHLKLNFFYTRVIQGDCAADLARLAYCYSNGVGCKSTELTGAVNLFDLSVRTGVLNMSEAVNVKALAYEVQFE